MSSHVSGGEESGRLPREEHGMSSHVSGGWRQGRGKISSSLLIWGDTGAHPMSPPEKGGAYLCPSLVSSPPLTWELIPCSPVGNLPLSSPHSHGSSSHVPPWVISRSPPPTHMGAHPMPLPLIGDMEAHPMSP